MPLGVSTILQMPREVTEVPMQIGNMVMWFRSDLGVTLETGDKVSTWADQSGNGYDALQVTDANRPVWIASAINGQPALLFDNSNDFLRNTLPNLDLRNVTIMAVSTQASTGNHAIIDISMTDGTTNDGHMMLQEGSLRRYRAAENGATPNAEYTYTTLNTPQVHFGIKRFDPTIAAQHFGFIYEKNVEQDSVNAQSQVDPFVAFQIGRLFQDVFPWDGYIAEIIVYSEELTSDQIDDLSTYAVDRYGI